MFLNDCIGSRTKPGSSNYNHSNPQRLKKLLCSTVYKHIEPLIPLYIGTQCYRQVQRTFEIIVLKADQNTSNQVTRAICVIGETSRPVADRSYCRRVWPCMHCSSIRADIVFSSNKEHLPITSRAWRSGGFSIPSAWRLCS